MNTVSMLASIARFMPTIWNSYSKSATARSPRTITVAPTSRAQSISRFSNGCTMISPPVRAMMPAHSASTIATRSSRLKNGCLSRLIATPITSRSTSAMARWMMSVCPSVIGSKVPG